MIGSLIAKKDSPADCLVLFCLYYRQTVWKEMVERERRKGNAYVESVDGAPRHWSLKLARPAALLVSCVAFIILLSTPTHRCWHPEEALHVIL